MISNFKRIEKKFWLNKRQLIEFVDYLKDKIETGDYKNYMVYNLYLDDDIYSLIRNSIKRPYFKEKIRLRCYGFPNEESKVFLELKRKLDGIGYKRRECLTYKRAMDLIYQRVEPETQIENEISEFIKRYHVKPKVILTYNRFSYYLKEDHDFRITFDCELKYAMWHNNFDFNEITKYIMNEPDDTLMEIKTSSSVPLWLSNKMNELKIYQAPFSKIGAVYTNHIKEN